MLYRKYEDKLKRFFETDKRALLVTGARQVGKTFTIEAFGRRHFQHFVSLNLLENDTAKAVFAGAPDTQTMLLRLSALCGQELVPGKTLILIDEVQECKEIVTAIKFLVQEGSYRYVLCGSLLGVELKDIRSVPVGYMDVMEMYPLDLYEFAIALGVSRRVIDSLHESFDDARPVDAVVHNKMLEIVRLYLVIGGMPAVVDEYLRSKNISLTTQLQEGIIRLYKRDIAKYDPDDKLYLDEIFDLIPSELNTKNKRFILKDLNEHFKFNRFSGSFLWLKNAGVALPTYCADEPVYPLTLTKETNLFKLFLNDIGLLAAMYMDGCQFQILTGNDSVNFGAVYENMVAQELAAHGFALYYYNNKKLGEIDFLIELGGQILPIEVKSGKTYKRHVALCNLMGCPDYNLDRAIVLCNGNVETDNKITYLPIYMTMFIEHPDIPQDTVYEPDIDVLR